MPRLDWKAFLAAGFPPRAAAAEADKDVLFRLHRWAGVRIAYPFYLLGVSGNHLSVLRLVMGIAGVALLLQTARPWWAVAGALLVYGQVLLDFSDGALARLSRPSALGELFDIIGCDAARLAMVVLLGLYTGSAALTVAAVGTGYVLTTFRVAAQDALPDEGAYKRLKGWSRRLMSDQWLVVLLPFGFAAMAVLGIEPRNVAGTLLGLYLALAVVWMAVAAGR